MFELAMPSVLILLLLPSLLWFFMSPVSLKISQALKLPFYADLMRSIRDKQHDLMFVGNKNFFYFFIIWFLLLLALAGPRWVGPPVPLQYEGRNLMLVMDLSESMSLDDMVLSGQAFPRLTVVKEAAKQFVRARTGDKIGLIVFGSRAYLQTPLTFDRASVLMRLNDATVGLAGNSTSIGDALGLAVKHLQNVPKKSRVIVLLTDGANNSGILTPSKAALLAKDDKIKVYTIGLGSDMSGFFNLAGAAQLDEKSLQDIADNTGGRYFRATDPKSLDAIYKMIDTLEKVNEEAAFVRPQKEYYIWPLMMAYVLLCYWLFARGWK